jgi:hypothetical protein
VRNPLVVALFGMIVDWLPAQLDTKTVTDVAHKTRMMMFKMLAARLLSSVKSDVDRRYNLPGKASTNLSANYPSSSTRDA